MATTAAQRAPTEVRLEFVHRRPGQEPIRYSSRVSGDLLEALHRGGPLSRVDLEQELEQAIRGEAPDDLPPDTDEG